MKYTLIIFLLCTYCIHTYGQVGIGTENPQSTLDVRGDITVRDKIYLGGSDDGLGDPGKKGQVLISQGPGNPPVWKSLNIPVINPDDFLIVFTNTYSDEVGITLSNLQTINTTTLYEKGDLRSHSKFNLWQDISGLTKTFNVQDSDSKVHITYEAVIHIKGQGSGYVDVGCGVFINDQLQGIRTATLQQVSGAQNPFHTFLMLVNTDNINEGVNQVKVACARFRNQGYTDQVGIGRAIETNINNFIAQSSLRIDIYESPEAFIPVVN